MAFRTDGWFAIVLAIKRLLAAGVIRNCFNLEDSDQLFILRIIRIYSSYMGKKKNDLNKSVGWMKINKNKKENFRLVRKMLSC